MKIDKKFFLSGILLTLTLLASSPSQCMWKYIQRMIYGKRGEKEFKIVKKSILASGSLKGEIKIWDISKPNNQELIKTLKIEKSCVKVLAFQPIAKTNEQKTFKKRLLQKQRGRKARGDLVDLKATQSL